MNHYANNHRSFIKLKSKSGSENVHYSALYEELPEEFEQIARQQLNETDEDRKEGMKELREFGKNENLTFTPDYLLLAILRHSKYDKQRSKASLKKFDIEFQYIKKLLVEMDIEKIVNIIDDMPYGILPYRDKYGRVIVYTRPEAVNLERYEVGDVVPVIVAAHLFLLKYPLSTVTGIDYLADCESPIPHIFYEVLKAMKKSARVLLSFPMRMSRVEIINVHWFARWICQILLPIYKKRIEERITFIKSGDDILQTVYDPDILSEEFGGNMGPTNNEFYREKLLDFIVELRKEKV